MFIDIVFVTYNSEKWIEGCFRSITECNYDLKNISIIVVDNSSTDKSLDNLKQIKITFGSLFRAFTIIESNKNLGFGKACNLGVSQCDSEFVFFLNIDTTLYPDTLPELTTAIQQSSDTTVVWELRQFPYEHPKIYNPVTLETSWTSGAAFVVRRDAFTKVGGFDENIFMYAEDVDLSWRIRMSGYKVQYVPKAVVNHFCYDKPELAKPSQYIYGIVNNLLLRYKYGDSRDIQKGYAYIAGALLFKRPFPGFKKRLITALKTSLPNKKAFSDWRQGSDSKFDKSIVRFYGLNYEHARNGAFYNNTFIRSHPKVSVIVRTCGRPDVLRETLVSIRNQTYTNIETVIVEDGPNISEDMITKEFPDLEIVYKATGRKFGRCRVGNIGLETATGEYLNFLDDDDLFYSDHTEVLVSQLQINKTFKAAYCTAFETPLEVLSGIPYVYNEVSRFIRYNSGFSREKLYIRNYLPIQCVMFRKELFDALGGFDEKLNMLEDWDLWCRYSMENDFLYIDKTTSIYRVPISVDSKKTRENAFLSSLGLARKKQLDYIQHMPDFKGKKKLKFFVGLFAEKNGRIGTIGFLLVKGKNILKAILGKR